MGNILALRSGDQEVMKGGIAKILIRSIASTITGQGSLPSLSLPASVPRNFLSFHYFLLLSCSSQRICLIATIFSISHFIHFPVSKAS